MKKMFIHIAFLMFEYDENIFKKYLFWREKIIMRGLRG